MKKKFSREARELLLKNKNVKTVTSTGIIYQDFFKQEAIDLYNQGYLPSDIFKNAGFDLDIIGKENPSKILSKWRSGFGYNGNNNNKTNIHDKYLKSNSKYTDKEIKKIIARNKYLEAENNFLKKLQELENRLK